MSTAKHTKFTNTPCISAHYSKEDVFRILQQNQMHFFCISSLFCWCHILHIIHIISQSNRIKVQQCRHFLQRFVSFESPWNSQLTKKKNVLWMFLSYESVIPECSLDFQNLNVTFKCYRGNKNSIVSFCKRYFWMFSEQSESNV